MFKSLYEELRIKSESISKDAVMKFVNEKLTWRDVCEHAELIKSDEQDEQFDQEWKTAKKEIIPWDKNLSIFDFISIGDIIVDG